MAKYPKNKKADNPNKDVTFIYESGGRDPEHPFGDETLEKLADETEGESGGWEVDLRNTSRREKGGYPAEEGDEWGYQKDVKCYPFYYSTKGSPRGKGYPVEKDWWKKALSFKREVESKYNVVIKD